MTLSDIVKKQLGLAWLDDDAREVIESQIEEGKAVLSRYSPDFDPAENPADRALIVEYVRYTRANARDDFLANYAREILSLSDRGRICRNANADTSDV